MLEKYKKYVKFKEYHAQYYYQARKFVNWCKDNEINYLNIKYENLMDFVLVLKDNKLDNGTINNYIRSIRFFYRYLIFLNILTEDILDEVFKLKSQKTITKVKDYLLEEELEEIIEMGMTFCYRIDPFKLRTIFRFLFFTGLRKSEFVNLKRKDFDFRKQTVYIKGRTKNRMEREVPLTKKVSEDVQSYFNTIPEIKNAFNYSAQQLMGLLIDIQDFVPNGKKLTTHTFRHSYGRLLARNGMNIREAQKLLGHKNVDSTLIYYDVTVEEAKKTFWEKIG